MTLLPMGPPTEQMEEMDSMDEMEPIDPIDPIDPAESQESMFHEPTHFLDREVEEGPGAGVEEAIEEVVQEEAHVHSHVEVAEPAPVEPAHTQFEFGEPEAQPEIQSEIQPESKMESAPESSTDATLPLTVDDFSALEDRVLRAVNLVRRERQARTEAEVRTKELEAQVLEQLPMINQLQKEVDSLRVEREQVRQRVERLLSQLDALEL
jgi:hypothetical protein